MGDHSYYLNEKDEFVIENYNQQKPFSSFLPAVSGLYGKPLWAYYVNRGQCIASFGVNNKDYSIMEFQPANKSYRLTALQGFRTFYKVKREGAVQFYEPFRDTRLSGARETGQKMRITSYDFKLEDNNEALGLRTEVSFCTLAEEEIPGLIRTVHVENTKDTPVTVEALDGLVSLIPYYLTNKDMKDESNLKQAWMSADLEDGLPFYRIKALPYDTAETVLLQGGNFYLNYCEEGGNIVYSAMITDPTLIFGNMTDFSVPVEFYGPHFNIPKEQVSAGYTPCAFGYREITLMGGCGCTFYTLVGSAPGLERYQSFLAEKIKPGYMEEKIAQNREIIERTKRHVFTSSSSKEFDLYMGQTFLDNYLRGGYPIQTGNGRHIMYVYSRKHGDLEREYNFFQVDSTNYSQGNSNFRDVNQNRRNDVYFFPFTKDAAIHTFFDMLQLDGFNPLVLSGCRFQMQDADKCRAVAETYFQANDAEKIYAQIQQPFTPGMLLLFIEQLQVKPRTGNLDRFINDLLECCGKEDCMVFQEGFWTDHWTYNIDLLEQFLAVYPDKIQEVLFDDESYVYYDNENYVVPREQRYVLTDAGVRQYGAVRKSEEKAKLISGRTSNRNQVRTEKGTGGIYHCTLASKVLVLLVNKVASLDPAGIGLDMEGGKPGWCDALNGLPGILGSSINESAEVRRLAALFCSLLEQAAPKRKIWVPAEAKVFFDRMLELLESGASPMDYWNASNEAKEAYRSKTLFGIDGRQGEVCTEDAIRFLKAAIGRLDTGLQKAYNEETGVYDTYFIHEVAEYEKVAQNGGTWNVRAVKFCSRAIPPFLEGQVHMMRAYPKLTEKLHDAVKKSGIYDEKLDMFKVNADIMSETKEIGRQNVFPRGWLENEAVFLHMEYKYFLELLRNGLYHEFFHYMRTSFVPFLDASVYGRSILENSSFIVSSAHPDERLHGTGYVSRLTGASAEMLTMWRIMTTGASPFIVNGDGGLDLELKPKLPGWLFTDTDQQITVPGQEGGTEFTQPADTFAYFLLGSTLVLYVNHGHFDTWDDGVKITKISLHRAGRPQTDIQGGVIHAPYAEKVRMGEYDRITAVFESVP